MLGKRRRSPPTMKRTTSMTGINVDGSWPLNPPQNHVSDDQLRSPNSDGHKKKLCATSNTTTWNDYRSSAMISPRYYMRDSAGDHRRRLETAPFLRTCGLCNRRLAIGRDIYMYRGDTAFCSEECREQQIKHDERKEKTLGKKATNIEIHHNHSDITYESSNNGETVAAA